MAKGFDDEIRIDTAGLDITGGVLDFRRQHVRVVFGHAVIGDEPRLLGVGTS